MVILKKTNKNEKLAYEVISADRAATGVNKHTVTKSDVNEWFSGTFRAIGKRPGVIKMPGVTVWGESPGPMEPLPPEPIGN